MIPALRVRAQGPLGRWADLYFEGIMRRISGAPKEATQKTHRWNNHHLKEGQVAHLTVEWMIYHSGDPNARTVPRVEVLSGALAHATKFGGWQRYLVLAPVSGHQSWYIGWRWHGGAGVSRVPINGSVRVLVGPTSTEWFGIDADSNIQIPIQQIGKGQIGDGGEFSQVPLF